MDFIKMATASALSPSSWSRAWPRKKNTRGRAEILLLLRVFLLLPKKGGGQKVKSHREVHTG